MRPAVCIMAVLLTVSCSLFGTRDSGARDSAPAWSPDGRHIAVSRQVPGKDDAHILILDLETMVETHLPVKALTLTWSPDGQMLCFEPWPPLPEPWDDPMVEVSKHLWIVRKDGTGLRQLTR